MSNIQIICDTMNDVPKEIVEKYNIEILPATIVFDGIEYKAGVDIEGDEFYKMLRSSNSMPTTSQVTYATFKDTFEKYLDEHPNEIKEACKTYRVLQLHLEHISQL